MNVTVRLQYRQAMYARTNNDEIERFMSVPFAGVAGLQ
jgi:hypothetical protein